MRLTISFFLFGLACLIHPAFAAEQSTAILSRISKQENVGAEVVTALSAAKTVRVFVTMREPDSRQLMTMRSSEGERPTIAQARSNVLSTLQAGDFELKRQFDHVSGFAGLANPRAVEAMANHPLVWRIDTDEGGSGSLGQSLAPVSYTHLRAHETRYTISYYVFCL